MNNKLAIYTSIFGGYDKLLEPEYINSNADYICFTDNQSLSSTVWKIIYIAHYSLSAARESRRYKILPHIFLPDYDHSLWIDANLTIKKDVYEYIDHYHKGRSAIFLQHPFRDCLYEEAKICKQLKIDNPILIDKQVAYYKEMHYPKQNGLVEGGVIYREHLNPLLMQTMNDWWDIFSQYSQRDQLAFNFVAWKNQFLYDVCDQNVRKSPYFEYHQHYTNLERGKDEFNKAQYKEAVRYLNESIQYLEKAINNAPALSFKLVSAYFYLGMSYYQLAEYHLSYNAFNQCDILEKKTNDKEHLKSLEYKKNILEIIKNA